MRFFVLFSAAVACSACATTQPTSSEPVARAELAATGETSVYDALRSLRPDWIRRTLDAPAMGIARRAGDPPPSATAVACLAMAYVGDEPAEEEDLRRRPLEDVLEVRLIPPRARRPDGSRCTHDRPAIHVVVLG